MNSLNLYSYLNIKRTSGRRPEEIPALTVGHHLWTGKDSVPRFGELQPQGLDHEVRLATFPPCCCDSPNVAAGLRFGDVVLDSGNPLLKRRDNSLAQFCRHNARGVDCASVRYRTSQSPDCPGIQGHARYVVSFADCEIAKTRISRGSGCASFVAAFVQQRHADSGVNPGHLPVASGATSAVRSGCSTAADSKLRRPTARPLTGRSTPSCQADQLPLLRRPVTCPRFGEDSVRRLELVQGLLHFIARTRLPAQKQ